MVLQGTSNDGTAAVSGQNTATIPAAPGNGVWPAAGVSGTSTKNGVGVIGFSDSGIGLWGHSNSDTGTGGVSETGIGVHGISTKGPSGVRGDCAAGVGVSANSVTGRAVEGNSPQGTGVVGSSTTGVGVYGVSDSLTGVGGQSRSGHGVHGVSETEHGVVGNANGGGAGVFAGSIAGEGVHGETNATGFTAGVIGIAANQNGIGPGVLGQSNGTGPGVVGKANGDAGVIGFHGDPRLQETTVANDGAIAGVFGASDVGSGVVGYSRNPATPAVFAFGGLRAFASNHPLAGLFDGNVQVNGDIFLPGADCAEHFEIANELQVEPGTVVIIDEDGKLRPCETAYDRKVAGVISGAGDYRPGLVLDKHETDIWRQPLALVGKVFCKVDASYASIAVGDLLTSSPTHGHAMKADDPQKAFGAVLGKSLDSLANGIGLVRVLVCLQ